jgi:hypothetical protein
MSESKARYGWESDFPGFREAAPAHIRERLRGFVADASPEQERAWRDAIPSLQAEVDEVLVRDRLAGAYSAILEYELPMDARRPDVVLLVGAGVMVVELKGKLAPSQADLDQASAYARDLRAYHRDCHGREVRAVLVPTRARGYQGRDGGVHVAGPDALDALVAELVAEHPEPLLDRARFLDESAYRPLPTLVAAARELFLTGELRAIHRARAATDPAAEEISRIVHQAALTKSRHLILVSGVPGAGKTLVGLRTVHAHYLDDLAVDRGDGKPTAPAVFLSGNGPLVEVLQYEFKGAGGGGQTFVRGVKDYVKRYSRRPELVPPEHVLVFDEAQRAYDAAMVQDKHNDTTMSSEPEQFIEFADRIPEWCVVVGLIGSGQEIHLGEEGGIGQWRTAVEQSARRAEWTIHAPPGLERELRHERIPLEVRSTLNLDTELRFHLASDLHRFVAELLTGASPDELAMIAARLEVDGYHLRITRDLHIAKRYLRDRYSDNRAARFGLVASSRDKDLPTFGVPNQFQDTKNLRVGPWYGDDEDAYGGHSCRRLERCVTEFGAQGLELDAALLAWGTDLMRDGGRWSHARARGYKRGAHVRDPFQLRLNAYRVLLTRGRDATVVYVPQLSALDETYDFLLGAGFRTLDETAFDRSRPTVGTPA